jgi:hypothetical protein
MIRLARFLLPEALLGDLLEEHALIAAAHGEAHANRWLRDQLLKSLYPVLRANAQSGRWLKAFGAMLTGYLVTASFVVISDLALGRFVHRDPALTSLAAGLPAMILGGYIAARLHPQAAHWLAVFVGLMGLLSLVLTGTAAPGWYQIALTGLGPIGALLGGKLQNRRKPA